MPKSSLHMLAWSQKDRLYLMYTDGILQHCCDLEETEAFWDWLQTCTSVSFQGQKGHLTLLKEMRTRGGGYWYAYGYRGQRKIKCYLGTTRKVTLSSLEEIAAGIINEQSTSIERSSAPAAAPLLGALLLPKFSPPRLPAGLVMRERLLTRLDQALTHAFTFLSASAGSGKQNRSAFFLQHSHKLRQRMLFTQFGGFFEHTDIMAGLEI